MTDLKPGLKDFTAEHFLPYQGQTLTFHRPEDDPQSPSGPVELTLIAVETFARGGSARAPFSLLFLSVTGETLGMSLPKLVDPAFEPCEMFLSRILPPAGSPAGVYYEAVFN